MAKTKHIPERRCVTCGQKFPKRDLIRIVRTPHGTVSVDTTGKSAGRGAYICTNSDCWRKGLAKGNLDRSLATPLSSGDREQILSYYSENIAGPSVATQ